MQRINTLNGEEMFRTAFSRAKKEMKKARRGKNKQKWAAEKEAARIKAVSKYLNERISAYIASFPSIQELSPFYQKMIEATIDLDELRKMLGHLRALNKIIIKIRLKSVRRIFSSRKEEETRKAGREFNGRVFSIEKQLKGILEKLNRIAVELNEIPSISFEYSTIILAGYPNTGKTTVLERLTGSKAKIAPYPFTTKRIELGYFEERFQKIQVIDTPGLLDREEEKRNPAEKKAINALRHLNGLIAFMFDPTKESGYSFEEQLNLLKEIKKIGKKIVVIINKQDIASEEEIKETINKLKEAETTERVPEEEIIIVGIGKEKELKEFVIRKMKKERMIQ